MSNNNTMSKAMRQAEKDLRIAREALRASLPAIKFRGVDVALPKRDKNRIQTVECKPSEVLAFARKQLENWGEESRITAAPLYPPVGNFGLEEEKKVCEYIGTLGK